MSYPAAVRLRAFPKLTAERAFRLGLGVTLEEAARRAAITLTRASLIERDPGSARPGELERLRKGVEAASREGGQ